MSEYNNYTPQSGDEPGKGAAIGSLVCGIISVIIGVVLGAFIITPIIGLILGIVGLVMSANARKAGFSGGLRTAGFVLSVIGVVFNAIAFVSCTLCAGGLACLGGLSGLS